MTGWLSFICGMAVLLAVAAVGVLVLWLIFGRKKHGEDKVVGVLEPMAHFKATTMIDGMQHRIR